MAPSENLEEVRAFFDGWRVYQQLIDNDYVGHRGAYGLLRRILERDYRRPFDLLDLGCGDASYISRTLKGTPAASYTGVDLSGAALGLAREQMAPRDCAQRLIQGDLRAAVQGPGRPVDIIWASLSLHHLALEEKAALLCGCRRRLRPGGCLLVFDPVLAPGERREEFLPRWWRLCKSRFRALSADARDALHEHVDTADFPEEGASLEALGRAAGFARVRPLYRDASGVYQLLAFTPRP